MKSRRRSVTSKACRCGALERLASAGNFVGFSEEEGCYHFTWYHDGEVEPFCRVIAYHCHFCGGVAPTATPKPRVCAVSAEEQRRLDGFAESIRTIEDCESLLGPPDRIDHDLFGYPKAESIFPRLLSSVSSRARLLVERFIPGLWPPEQRKYYVRRYVYTNVSDVVVIWVWDDNGRARFSYHPKPLPRLENPNPAGNSAPG